MYNQVIIIPSYQPSEKLIHLVKTLARSFSNILIVNDGSSEEYDHIFDALTDDGCIVLRHVVNQGKGRALKTAFNYCLIHEDFASDGIITVDGDGQHMVCDVERLAGSSGIFDHIILGCRAFDSNLIPLRSRFGNIVSKYVYRWSCGIDISDTQTGLRAIPFSCLRLLCSIEGERYEYETNMLIALNDRGYKIEEMPINTVYEDGNISSHFNPFRDSVRIYLIILKYCISSLVTVVVDYLFFSVFISIGIKIILSTYLARLFAMIVNFTVNRKIVFNRAGNVYSQFIKYLALVLVSASISGYLVGFLDNHTGLPILLSKAMIEFILFFVNYYVQSRYVFQRQGK